MDAVSTARQFILDHPWAVIAVVVVAIVLLRGLSVRARARIRRADRYAGAPKDPSAVRDSGPVVSRARRQMIMALIALAVVAILVIIQNLH